MGKYDDLIGGGKIILDVEEVLNEESAKKVDDRIKKQKAELSQPIEVDVKTGKAEKRLSELNKAAKQIKTDLQEALSSQNDFEEINGLVSKYKLIQKQIKAITPEIDKNNKSLKEGNQLLKDTKKIIDQLSVSQSKLNKPRRTKKATSTAGTVGTSGDSVDIQRQVTAEVEATVAAQVKVADGIKTVVDAREKEIQVLKKATEEKRKYYEIDEKAARLSKQMRSFDDYKEGSATASYKAAVDKMAEIIEEKKKQFPDKSDKLDQLLDRYAKNLAQFINRDNQIGAQYPSVMISGAGNYNIKKHDKQMASWGKNFQFYEDKVAALENQIRNLGSAGTDVIRGDESDSLEKLEAKVEYLKYWHEVMVEANKYYRKHKTLDGFEGADPDELERIKKDLADIQRVGMYDIPYPSYRLTNDNQNIKRLEGRIAELKRLKDNDGLQEENDIYKLWTDKQDMRIRISFEIGKPDREIIDMLKGKGFKWARSQGVWQRQLTDNAVYSTKQLQKSLHEFYKIEDQSQTATVAIEDQTKATEKLAEARLQLTKKEGTDLYTAMDGKYEIGQDAEGWKVYQRDNAGLWNLIDTYRHLDDIRNDSSLLTREEIVLTDEVVQEVKTLQKAYSSMDHKIQGHTTVVNKYLEVLDAVKSGAMGAAYAVEQLNVAISGAGLSSTKEKLNNIGYHAGDLGKAEYYSDFVRNTRWTGFSRGSGHLGTGTYFVGNPNQIRGYNTRNGVEAPWAAVDFSYYNLFKPENTEQAWELHAALKQINDDLLYMHKYDGVDLSFLQQAIDAGNMKPISSFIKTYLSDREYSKYEDEALSYKDYLERSDINSVRAEIEKSHYDIGKELGDAIDDMWLIDDELIEEEVKARIAENKNALKNFNLGAEIVKRVAYDMEHGKFESISEMQELKTNLTDRLARIFVNTTKDEIASALEYTFKTISQYPESVFRSADNASATFMQRLGYEGIDTRHTGLDDTGVGSVIYNLKEESIILKGITDERQKQLLLEGKIAEAVKLGASLKQSANAEGIVAAQEKMADLIGDLYGNESLTSKISQIADLTQAELEAAFKNVNLDALFKTFEIAGEEAVNLKQKFIDMLKIGASDGDLAQAVLESLTDDVVKLGAVIQTTDKIYDDFRKRMSKVKLLYNDEIVAEYGTNGLPEWGEFAKANRDYISKSLTSNNKKGKHIIPADTLMQELVEQFPGFFSEDDLSKPIQEQFVKIMDVWAKARQEFGQTKQEILDFSDSDRGGIQGTILATWAQAFNALELYRDQQKRQIEASKEAAEQTESQVAAEESLADAARKTAEEKERQTGAGNGIGSSDETDDITETILNRAERAVDMIGLISSAAGKSAATKFLEGITDESDLDKRIVSYFNEALGGGNWKFKEGQGAWTIKGSTYVANLVNDSQDALHAVFKLDDGVLKLQEDLLKFDGANIVDKFDLETATAQASASLRDLKAQLGGRAYDGMAELQGLFDKIVDEASFNKFTQRFNIAKQEVAALKKEYSSGSGTLNDFSRATEAIRTSETYIKTARLQLESLGDVDGVDKATEALNRMAEASKAFKEATDEAGQKNAYTQYNQAKADFEVNYDYAKEAKRAAKAAESEQIGSVKNQYQSILDLINKINTANERMVSYQQMDGGSGIFGGKMREEMDKKAESVARLQEVLSELNLSGVFGKDQYTIPDGIQSIGVDYSQISAFINDAGVQASLTTKEIDKLVNALTKAGDIDLSVLRETLGNESLKQRAKQMAYENQYFGDKQKYSENLKIEDIQKLGTASNTTKEQLEGMAQAIAQNSDGAVALTKNFSMGADGIAKLDFSVLDTNTGFIKDFTIALGTATGQVAVFDTTVDKSAKNMQKARSQMEAAKDLIGRLGFGDIIEGDPNTPKQISDILAKIRQLSEAMLADDQNKITEYTKDLQLMSKEVEKVDNQMRKMESAIESGAAKRANDINPNGDIYGQLVKEAQKLAETEGAVTLETGKFDKATNTLNFSLTHANGTVEQLKMSMYGLEGQVAYQQTGVTKLTTNWDRFSATIGKVGKQLLTALVGYNVFYKAISEVRKGIGYVKEIDLALTELKKVTDETEESYRKFLDTAASSAGKIGSTVSDFTEATANFARLGYTMEESANMAETAIVYKNVADGLDTVDEATDSIISTMKAFGIESDDTMGIIDRFNEVGNNFAITSAGIGEALQRSASALYEGGNTIDEAIGLVTGANSVIQNPEQVGTALKTKFCLYVQKCA